MNKFSRSSAVVAAAAAFATQASAEVSAEITTALSDMKADGLVIAGAVLVAIIAISAFKILRRGI